VTSNLNDEPLQFETATPSVRGAPEAPQGVTCTACQQPIADQYYDVNGQPVCASCREMIEERMKTPRGFGVLIRASLFALVAAILGAVLYYAVIAITNFEIGIVAIAIGYMVGYAIRMATGGRGGRRFQVLAVVLTYWAVGLAYTPLVFRDMNNQNQQASQTSTTETPTPATAPAPADPQSSAADDSSVQVSLTFAILFLIAFSFALPVLSVVSSMPGGLISAAIIAFGMHQAWRMTGVPHVEITGPYRIAAPVASA
jgi:hypothetical protein